MAILTATAIRVSDGLDSEAIKTITEYSSSFGNSNGMIGMLSEDAGILLVIYKIKEYSHWIFTGCIIWSILITYFSTRKVDKTNEKIYSK